MIFKHGTYTSAAGEVRLLSSSRAATLNSRGAREKTVYTISIEGFIKATGQSTIKTAIGVVETAFVDTVTGITGLYHDDGTTVSGHSINAANMMNGVRVMSLDWQDGPGEYATGRTYRATFMGELSGLTASSVIAYQETISISGTGGARYAYLEPITGLPLRQQINQNTLIRARQFGTAVNYGSPYPSIPSPLWPTLEDFPERVDEYIGPTYRDGVLRDYGRRWGYTFTSGQPFSTQYPNTG